MNCLVPAKLGDLYRSYLVKRRFGVSLSRTVGVVVAERLLDLFVVFGLLIIGGYVAFGRTVLPDLWLVYASGAALAVLGSPQGHHGGTVCGKGELGDGLAQRQHPVPRPEV